MRYLYHVVSISVMRLCVLESLNQSMLTHIVCTGQYAPDFMAYISSKELRFLCIFLPQSEVELADAKAVSITSNANNKTEKIRRRGSSKTRHRKRSSSFIDRKSSHITKWWQWFWGEKDHTVSLQEVQSPMVNVVQLESGYSQIELRSA